MRCLLRLARLDPPNIVAFGGLAVFLFVGARRGAGVYHQYISKLEAKSDR